MIDRLTRKTVFGDYGAEKEYESRQEEIQTLRNALGKYEDLGLSPEEIEEVLNEQKHG